MKQNVEYKDRAVSSKRQEILGFPGGPVVKIRLQRAKIPHAREHLRPCVTTTEPVL